MWMMHLHLQVQNYVKLNARLQLDAVGDELWQWTLRLIRFFSFIFH